MDLEDVMSGGGRNGEEFYGSEMTGGQNRWAKYHGPVKMVKNSQGELVPKTGAWGNID
jgi:hypothetical protein